MSEKTTQEIVNEKLKNDEIEDAFSEVTASYIQAVLQLLHLKKHGELTFFKKNLSMSNGTIYLIQIVHVKGPKIDVQKLFKEAEEHERKTNPENPQA